MTAQCGQISYEHASYQTARVEPERQYIPGLPPEANDREKVF